MRSTAWTRRCSSTRPRPATTCRPAASEPGVVGRSPALTVWCRRPDLHPHHIGGSQGRHRGPSGLRLPAGQPGAPTGLSEGDSAEFGRGGRGRRGCVIGDSFDLTAAEATRGRGPAARCAVLRHPTAYITEDLYGQIVKATNPGVPFVPGSTPSQCPPKTIPQPWCRPSTSRSGDEGLHEVRRRRPDPGVASISQTFGTWSGSRSSSASS